MLLGSGLNYGLFLCKSYSLSHLCLSSFLCIRDRVFESSIRFRDSIFKFRHLSLLVFKLADFLDLGRFGNLTNELFSHYLARFLALLFTS